MVSKGRWIASGVPFPVSNHPTIRVDHAIHFHRSFCRDGQSNLGLSLHRCVPHSFHPAPDVDLRRSSATRFSAVKFCAIISKNPFHFLRMLLPVTKRVHASAIHILSRLIQRRLYRKTRIGCELEVPVHTSSSPGSFRAAALS